RPLASGAVTSAANVPGTALGAACSGTFAKPGPSALTADAPGTVSASGSTSPGCTTVGCEGYGGSEPSSTVIERSTSDTAPSKLARTCSVKRPRLNGTYAIQPPSGAMAAAAPLTVTVAPAAVAPKANEALTAPTSAPSLG